MELKFTNTDYVNLRKLLDRVEVKGVQESMVVAVLAQKLESVIKEEDNVQDTPSANE